MLITLRPGANRDDVLQTLVSLRSEVSNLQSGATRGTYERLLTYLEWANNAVSTLTNRISDGDIERLVLTRRYEKLLSAGDWMVHPNIHAQRVINGLISAELQRRTEALDKAIKTLQAHINRWQETAYDAFLAPDTSFYIQHPEKLEEADFYPLTSIPWQDVAVHILVPIIVGDELDKLKESKDRQIRWRASSTLAVFERVLPSSTGEGSLRPGNNTPSAGPIRGPVAIEILFDPPQHVRLPLNDDEIIDRVAAVAPLTGRPVRILTYDTGQAMRARAAGLQVTKLTRDTADQPP